MTSTTRDRLISWGGSALISIFVVFGTFGLNRGAVRNDAIIQQIDKKVEKAYVDDQDNAIKSDVKDFKLEQEKRHTTEMQQVDKKLDLILEIIKAQKLNQ